ncbi:MAG: hypothetical protein Q8P63_01005 [Candidatus Nealsonbacteria bacterium]|nr:hypothetical protein [Candidatus Nealsonbacteria bacterium]
MKKYIVSILIINIFFLGLPIYQTSAQIQAPETINDVKTLGLEALKQLPRAVKDVWDNEGLPFFLKMWGWVKGFWDSTLGNIVETWWQKLLKALGKEMPDINQEFQKEKKEMEKDLWERFKDLLN